MFRWPTPARRAAAGTGRVHPFLEECYSRDDFFVQYAHLVPRFFVAAANVRAQPLFHRDSLAAHLYELNLDRTNSPGQFVQSVHLFLEERDAAFERRG
jgi:hypothetical protein